MSVSERLDNAQRRHRALGFPLATIYKFADDNGNYLAALLTYYAFISILPLLLLASTILSVLLVGHPDLQTKLLDSALAQFPFVGKQLKAPAALGGGVGAVVVGIVGATYGALGAAQALQFAGNTIWHIQRNKRPNPFLARLRSLALVATAGLGMLVAVVGTAVLHAVFHDSTVIKLLTFLGGGLIAIPVLLVAFALAPNRRLTVRQLLPGALFAAILLELLQSFGYVYVGRVVRHATDINAVFALVLGIIAYLYVAALIMVFSMEINAVRAEHLWPRALLSPFTDNVDLTDADEDAYTAQAQAQQTKGFEEIDVTFNDPE